MNKISTKSKKLNFKTYKDVLYEIKGLEGKELRDYYLNNYFLLMSKELFKLEPKAKMCCLAVASYYNDQAEDELHFKLLLSTQTSYFLPDLLNSEINELAKEHYEEYEPGKKYCYLTNYGEKYDLARQNLKIERYAYDLGNDQAVIDAFLPYCLEGADQEMEHLEVFQPYACVYKNDDGSCTMNVVGDVLRIFK